MPYTQEKKAESSGLTKEVNDYHDDHHFKLFSYQLMEVDAQTFSEKELF